MFGKVFKAVVGFQFITSSVLASVPGPWQPIAAANAMLMGALQGSKNPRSVGQESTFMVGGNNPLPYLIGEAYTEGVELYRTGWGGKVNKTQNPYAFIPRVLSCCGPIQSMGTTWVNHEAVTLAGSVGSAQPVASGGYYENFLWADQQLGNRPESDALTAPSGWGTPPDWSSAHKLSGMAAVGWFLKWDKAGERFTQGVPPPLGKVPQGVFAYDPRLDSTFPGGSGSHRITDESTWTYTRNPALHSATYAYGRKVNGVPVFGGRFFDADSINLADVVAWANVCDANGWTVNGTIFEPADKWNNLKLICEAGAARPALHGGVLNFHYQAPRTSLYTVTLADLVAAPGAGRLGRRWKDSRNTLVARYRSAAHQWTYQQAEAVVVAAFLTEDGEEKTDERQWDMVTDVDQVTELATYDLYQRREGGPFTIVCKPHMRIYGPGDCLTLAAELGVHPAGAIKAVVTRQRAAGDDTVTLELVQETDAKHTAALGAPGAASTPAGRASTADVDQAWVVNTAAPLELENEYDSTSGAITPYDTWVTVASRTGTAPDGGVVVQVAGIVQVLDNCKYKFRLLCDGTQVGDPAGPITVQKDDQMPLQFPWAHSPTAGSHTWDLQVQVNNHGIIVANPLIQLFKQS